MTVIAHNGRFKYKYGIHFEIVTCHTLLQISDLDLRVNVEIRGWKSDNEQISDSIEIIYRRKSR